MTLRDQLGQLITTCTLLRSANMTCANCRAIQEAEAEAAGSTLTLWW
ncbi:hypothetical protein [Rhodococcus sp. NPDC057529]